MPVPSTLLGACAAGPPVGSGRRRPGGSAAAVRWRLALLLGLVAALAAGVAAPARAQTVPVVADQYDVDLTVQTDGALAVVERLSLDFAGGPFRHGQRIIPLARVEAIRDVQVGEPGRPYAPGQNSPNTFNTHRDGNVLYVDWWFPATTNASRVFEIRYRAEGAIRIYPGGDQVDWQAIPGDLEYPVRAASVTVHTPGAAARAAAYPERRNVAISPLDPRTMSFTTANLPAHSGLDVRVQFPHGLVSAQPPAWQAEADRADWLNQNLRPALNFILLLLGLLIPVASLVALGALWMVRGRDPGVKAGAPVLDTPPSDLPAPLVGTLLDEHADEHDVVAALVDLANRGVLRIAPIQETAPVPGWTADYEIT